MQLINGMLTLVKNPCTRWVMLGGAFRFWQMTIMSFYCVTYFNYYNKRNLFGILNALVILGGGLTSSLVVGKLSDKYEKVNYRAKSYLATLLSAIAVPLFMALYLQHYNFYVSLVILFLENLLCEGWMAPCIAMIQQVIEVKYKAVSVGVFFFATAMSQTLSTIVVGNLVKSYKLDDPANINQLGFVLMLNTSVPCFLATFCFYLSGSHYEKQKRAIEDEKEEASIAASDANLELSNSEDSNLVVLLEA